MSLSIILLLCTVLRFDFIDIRDQIFRMYWIGGTAAIYKEGTRNRLNSRFFVFYN